MSIITAIYHLQNWGLQLKKLGVARRVTSPYCRQCKVPHRTSRKAWRAWRRPMKEKLQHSEHLIISLLWQPYKDRVPFTGTRAPFATASHKISRLRQENVFKNLYQNSLPRLNTTEENFCTYRSLIEWTLRRYHAMTWHHGMAASLVSACHVAEVWTCLNLFEPKLGCGLRSKENLRSSVEQGPHDVRDAPDHGGYSNYILHHQTMSEMSANF